MSEITVQANDGRSVQVERFRNERGGQTSVSIAGPKGGVWAVAVLNDTQFAQLAEAIIRLQRELRDSEEPDLSPEAHERVRAGLDAADTVGWKVRENRR